MTRSVQDIGRSALLAMCVAFSGCALPPPAPVARVDWSTLPADPECVTVRQCERLVAKAAEMLPAMTGMKLQIVSSGILETFNPNGFGRLGARVQVMPLNESRSVVLVKFTRCYFEGPTCDKDLYEATKTLRSVLANEAALYSLQSGISMPAQAVAAPGAAAPMLPVPAGNPKRATEGQYAFEAERIPAAKACAAMPQATLVNKGPGFELYSVACRNADTLMVRCELGNCRPLK